MSKLDIFDFKVQIVKALANPLRLAICEYLLEVKEPKCVNHIASHFEQNQSTISKHLSILQQEGIISLKKEGNFMRYYIQDKTTLQCFIDAVNGILEYSLKKHSEALKSLKI